VRRAHRGRIAGAVRAFPATDLALLDVDCSGMKNHIHARKSHRLLAAAANAVLLTVLLAAPAYAASDLNSVIDSVRDWVAGLLIALSTLFLTVGGVRYIPAQGDPRAVEAAKAGIKPALIGYPLAAIGPTLASILHTVL